MQEKPSLLTRRWQKARILLFVSTQEQNKIMSVIIPVAVEELDPVQSGHAHLPGMHQPIRDGDSELLSYMTSLSVAFSEHSAFPLRRSLHKKSFLTLLAAAAAAACTLHQTLALGSDQQVFIGEIRAEQTKKGGEEREKSRTLSSFSLTVCTAAQLRHLSSNRVQR